MHKHKILIVEDDPDLRDTLQLLLEDLYDVTCVYEGLESFKTALNQHPDLVLMDLKMPNMDGFEACRMLRADPQFSDVSVIVVSGFVSDQDRVRALEAGANEFLGKPFETKDLFNRIQKQLQLKTSAPRP